MDNNLYCYKHLSRIKKVYYLISCSYHVIMPSITTIKLFMLFFHIYSKLLKYSIIQQGIQTKKNIKPRTNRFQVAHMALLDNLVTRSQQCRKMDLGFEKFHHQSLLKPKQTNPNQITLSPPSNPADLYKPAEGRSWNLICSVIILPVNWFLSKEDFFIYSSLIFSYQGFSSLFPSVKCPSRTPFSLRWQKKSHFSFLSNIPSLFSSTNKWDLHQYHRFTSIK